MMNVLPILFTIALSAVMYSFYTTGNHIISHMAAFSIGIHMMIMTANLINKNHKNDGKSDQS